MRGRGTGSTERFIDKIFIVGVIMIAVSASVLGVSVFTIYSTINHYNEYRIGENGTENISFMYSPGNTIDYSVHILTNNTNKFQSFLLSPQGNKFACSNFTGIGTSESIISQNGGLWHFIVKNENTTRGATLSIFVGVISIYSWTGAYTGASLLIVGIIIVGFYKYKKR
ncbi:hypothetical protein [Caldiplasma sukawensis]